eukprot:scaffold1638_cov258-Pinguiococcus_pyrenoidosus.AAC.54
MRNSDSRAAVQPVPKRCRRYRTRPQDRLAGRVAAPGSSETPSGIREANGTIQKEKRAAHHPRLLGSCPGGVSSPTPNSQVRVSTPRRMRPFVPRRPKPQLPLERPAPQRFAAAVPRMPAAECHRSFVGEPF